MRQYNLLFFAVLLFNCTVMNAQQVYKTISPDKIMEMGVYYYPEHWPESDWERDMKNIASHGFEFTHFAEFAWAFLEPEEGKFDFAWLDKAVDIADKQGLKVIMCTPTPTPPAWLTKKYPETLLGKNKYSPSQHGSRQHCSWSSDKYKELTRIIVEKLAERYGNDNRIWGWQIDNEPSHYGWYDYSPAAQKRFRLWLKEKYGNIDALNKAWGNAFWSQMYNDFSQIEIPDPSLLMQPANPHAMLDHKRFYADEAAGFIDFQAKILKEKVDEKQWITTNYMSNHEPIEPKRSKYLDFITYTSYPVSGYGSGDNERFRKGGMEAIGFANDYFRPYANTTGVMEMQISQISWGMYNTLLYPGIRRVYLFHALAGGCEFACSYRYRQPTYGWEQNLVCMVGTDGVTPTDGGEEYIAFIKELNALRERVGALKRKSRTQPKRVAILFTYEHHWSTHYQKHTTQWNYTSHVMKYYKAAKAMGADVDFINDMTSLNTYDVVIAPSYELVDDKTISAWEEYVENGGEMIITCRSGLKSKTGHYFTAPRGMKLERLIGAKLKFYDNLPSDQKATVHLDGESFTWNNWGEGLVLQSANAVATHADQFYKEVPAISKNKLGNGNAFYVGVDTDDGKLEKRVVELLFNSMGSKVTALPEGVFVTQREGVWYAMNYSHKPFELPVSDEAEFLIGSKILGAVDVAVWIE